MRNFKIILSSIIILILTITGCMINEIRLSKKTTQELYNKLEAALNKIETDEYIYMYCNLNGKESIAMKTESYIVAAEKDCNTEKYWSNDSMYIFDKESNTKTKKESITLEKFHEIAKYILDSTNSILKSGTTDIQGYKVTGGTAPYYAYPDYRYLQLTVDNIINENSNKCNEYYHIIFSPDQNLEVLDFSFNNDLVQEGIFISFNRKTEMQWEKWGEAVTDFSAYTEIEN